MKAVGGLTTLQVSSGRSARILGEEGCEKSNSATILLYNSATAARLFSICAYTRFHVSAMLRLLLRAHVVDCAIAMTVWSNAGFCFLQTAGTFSEQLRYSFKYAYKHMLVLDFSDQIFSRTDITVSIDVVNIHFMQVSVLANVGGKSLMSMIKRIFPQLMTTALERRFSLKKPREGKMAFKPLRLFSVICSKLLRSSIK